MLHVEADRLLAAGHALRDLDAEERRTYDGHRADCPHCLALEDDLDQVLADLALIAPERLPPPSLLNGILAEIGDATTFAPRPVAVTPAGVRSPFGLPVPRLAGRPSPGVGLGLAAALAVVALGLGGRVASLSGELAVATDRLAGLQQRLQAQGALVALAIAPDRVQAALHAEALAPGATASVVYRPGTHDALLVADGLPATPEGRVYQLWVADASGVHGLGTQAFDGQGTFIARFDVDLATVSAAMVTLEPVGGAQGEPGPQVVFGEL